MDELTSKFKSIYTRAQEYPKSQCLSLIPTVLEHVIDYSLESPIVNKTFSLKNNSSELADIEGYLRRSNCSQISISIQKEVLGKKFRFSLKPGTEVVFFVQFNPKFCGSDKQIVKFVSNLCSDISISINLECLINPLLNQLVRSSEPPSNADLIYYIPSISAVRPRRKGGPPRNILFQPRYTGNIEDEDLIQMAATGNYDPILSLFKNGLTPTLYKKLLGIAVKLDHYVGQIEMSAHDISSVMDKFKEGYFEVEFPGIVDEDYIIGPGANDIYVEYYNGDRLLSSCLCEYVKIDKEEGIVRVRPSLLPGEVGSFTRAQLRVKQSIVPMKFSLFGIDRLCDHTINDVLFPVSIIPDRPFVVQAIDIQGRPFINFYNKKLNWRQKMAVCNILEGKYGRLPFILFGPPGTGKTTTVIESILQIFKLIPSSVILVTAQTNKSVDQLALRLIKTGQFKMDEIIRYNSQMRSPEDVDIELKPYCCDAILYSRVQSLRIVCTTFVKSSVFSSINDGKFFTHLFVDEASQCAEASTLISINLLKSDGKLILAGDPHQLGPLTTITNDYVASIITNSLLHRLIGNKLYSKVTHKHTEFGGYNPILIVKLVENYRNFEVLVSFFSNLFYDNELITKTCLADNNRCHDFQFLRNKNFPLLIHGVCGQDYLPENSTSFVNVYEAITVIDYIKQIINHGIPPHLIAVISFYKKQVMFIKRMLANLSTDVEQIECQTIEKFQGSEKTVVILSAVRTARKHTTYDKKFSLKFLFNAKRFNVAISRAISMLIVIGDPNVMKCNNEWSELLNYCRKNNSYIGCSID